MGLVGAVVVERARRGADLTAIFIVAAPMCSYRCETGILETTLRHHVDFTADTSAPQGCCSQGSGSQCAGGPRFGSRGALRQGGCSEASVAFRQLRRLRISHFALPLPVLQGLPAVARPNAEQPRSDSLALQEHAMDTPLTL